LTDSSINGTRARLIAYYLPQYHPIPENDKWWGKGFTEWVNVARARPLFRGHYQPHIPADLGFYDLRVPETRLAQAEMAREHGIEAFCYWHYWYGGRLLLERPFEEVLQSGEPDFPFCLGWANHSWEGVWFGASGRTLIEQTYPGLEDHKAHFYYLLQAFEDDRYLAVDGKPLLHVYRPYEIPDVKTVMDFWRELAVKVGLKGLHLVGEGLGHTRAKEFGFDAWTYCRHRTVEKILPKKVWVRRCVDFYRDAFRRPSVYSYKQALPYFLKDGRSALNEYPSIVPNWDSTPRFGTQGVVLHNAEPELFRAHVKEALQSVAHKPWERRIIFIKSWNEWAEGNHLEPDRKYGRARLEVVRDEILVADGT
jgi:hypothetical protein